jgi:glycosyltransferase involved in cell wall biosynthesis
VAWQAKYVFDAMAANTREVQYHMLTTFGVRSVYIPQGYEEDVLADIPAAYWGLRRGQYSLSFLGSDDVKEAKSLITAYMTTKTRKKLVIPVLGRAAWQTKLEKKYPLVVFLLVASDRPLHSLIHQAAMVVLYGKEVAARTVLQAMAATRPIVAINYPAYQEVLGTTAQFLRIGDMEGLTKAMTDIVFYPTRQEAWGKKAALRAKSHFTLARIAEEYETLYHYPLVRRVGVDSLQARRLAVN